jgi:MauM/NapG family ferredoxin protein
MAAGRRAELTGRRHRRFRLLQLIRILTQVAFFSLFVYLLLETRFSGKDSIGVVERFFHFDPLLGLTTFLASRTFVSAFLLALVTVGVTVTLGRHVCGWLCPLGALLQFFSFTFKKARWLRPRLEGSRRLSWKYVILLFVLVGSAFTVNLAGLLDPLSFVYRSFATAVLPALAVTAGATAGLLRESGALPLGDGLARFMQDLTLNATFHQGLAIGLMFAGVMMLNLLRERFWCRYVCPAGAMLGALARWNLVKLKVDTRTCDNCNLCALHCETQASPSANGDWRPAECVYCYTCASICPKAAVSFPIALAPVKSKPIDLLRRRLVLAPALGLIAVPLLRISASAKRASEKLIRPPGSLSEPQFLAKCVKCGECMKACPTGGLQPALAEAGVEGLWTPVLVPRIGYCEYYCSICTQVCPTGAIRELAIKEKIRTRIGAAWVRTHRCLAYVRGETCTVCEESCPTSPKAITLHAIEVLMPDDTVAEPKVPLVDPDVCIGCGVCETKCPVVDEPAIYCTSAGESRADTSGLRFEAPGASQEGDRRP